MSRRTTYGLSVSVLIVMVAAAAAQKGPATVSLWVEVTGTQDSPITGLKQSDFRISEDGVDQTITSFSPDGPTTIAFVIGVGGLSARKDFVTAGIRSTVDAFQKASHPGNHYFIDSYGADGVEGAANRALSRVAQVSNPRKAVILIIDGRDDPGGSQSPSMDSVLKQDIPVHFLFVNATRGSSLFSAGWLNVLQDVARSTGGSLLFSNSLQELETQIAKLAKGIRNQYVIGYIPAKPPQDGKWHKLKLTTSTANAKLKYRPQYFSTKPKK